MSFPGFLYEFADSPISVAFPSYLALNLTAATSPTQLYWPFQQPYQPTPFSSNMFILTNDNAANIIQLPDATAASTSQSSILLNISADTAILQDFNGGFVGNITALEGLSYYLVLTSNTSPAGSWTLIPFGTASLAPIDVTSLVDTQANTVNPNVFMQGGLAAVLDTQVAIPGTYLKVNTFVQNYNSAVTPYTQTEGDRGTLMVVTGASNLTYDLLKAGAAAGQAPNGFVFSINNAMPSTSGGTVTLTTQGGDTIGDTATSFTVLQSQSLSLISDGVDNWTTLGYGLNTTPSSFVDVSVSFAGGSNALPSLNFYQDATHSLGIFYNAVGNTMQIVQTPIAIPTAIIADFYATAAQPLGFVTLATNSTFNGTEADLFGATFQATIANLFTSTFTPTGVSLLGGIAVVAPTYITVGNGTTTNVTMTASTDVDFTTPSLQQQTISIYSLMRAYS
jgi:hypothetical protein